MRTIVIGLLVISALAILFMSSSNHTALSMNPQEDITYKHNHTSYKPTSKYYEILDNSSFNYDTKIS
ncbi:hypothetical protein K9M79_06740 [Candidatus Woesearchaeota archaeon]|nr:hypothetical protein [Candidatus Woesearchaeota archaeon]